MVDRQKQGAHRPSAGVPATAAENAVRRLYSTQLFKGSDLLIIEHAGREYRLRVTSNGKLILTA
ncbi:MAG: hemin uptake protein HemP [Sulfuricaulis sp.]|uniref:hemin uptake protein HemP n=1 Tax=Sulfuricaulis sp. TaxID=2003553 RepID=UPI0034A34F4D